MPGKTGGSGAFGLLLEHRRELEAWEQRFARRMPGVFFQVPMPSERAGWPQHWGRGPALEREHRATLRAFDAALRSR